ncbi:hypothetical protein [Spongiimicrobium sp. 2-473A-2-J]|uniref:hypothetical protein n=1 Tax=Eudoraea algarum TaxID=3417568 RepID=UPI003D36BE7C
MTKTTTNLIGIAIAILAGTYFFVMYCSECGANPKEVSASEATVPKDDLPQMETTAQSGKERPDHGQAKLNLH